MGNKLSAVLCVTALCVTMALIVSCTKKNDRLVSDTLVISITPQPVIISTGTAKSLTAVCKSAKSSDANILPTWTVDSPSLGTFSPKQGKTTTFTATALAGAAGTGKIYATYSNIKASANVVVSTGAVIGSITIFPSPVSVSTGTPQVFTATCKDTSGNVMSVIPTWSVSQNSLGQFSSLTGNSVTFTAASPVAYAGKGTIKATYGAVSGSASITVSSNAANSSIYGLLSSAYDTDGYTHINLNSPNPPDPNGGTIVESDPLGFSSDNNGFVCTVGGNGTNDWSIQFGYGAGVQSKDMSAFKVGSTVGTLQFDVQTNNASMFIKIRIQTGDNTYENAYTPTDTGPHSFAIPLKWTGTSGDLSKGFYSTGSAPFSIDLANIQIPAEFFISDQSGLGCTVNIENIRWVKP